MELNKLIKPGQIACLDFPKTTKVKSLFITGNTLHIIDKNGTQHSAEILSVDIEDFATVVHTKDGSPWIFYN